MQVKELPVIHVSKTVVSKLILGMLLVSSKNKQIRWQTEEMGVDVFVVISIRDLRHETVILQWTSSIRLAC